MKSCLRPDALDCIGPFVYIRIISFWRNICEASCANTAFTSSAPPSLSQAIVHYILNILKMAATTSHFSASQSDFRTSQSHPNATQTFSYSDSPLTQLPSIDFNFDDLRRRMNDFSTKFDAYIERGRKRVLEERNEFRARLSELNGKPDS